MLTAIYFLLMAVVVLPFVFFGESFDALAKELMSGRRVEEIFLVSMTLLALDIFIPVPSSAMSVSAGMFLGMPMAF